MRWLYLKPEPPLHFLALWVLSTQPITMRKLLFTGENSDLTFYVSVQPNSYPKCSVRTFAPTLQYCISVSAGQYHSLRHFTLNTLNWHYINLSSQNKKQFWYLLCAMHRPIDIQQSSQKSHEAFILLLKLLSFHKLTTTTFCLPNQYLILRNTHLFHILTSLKLDSITWSLLARQELWHSCHWLNIYKSLVISGGKIREL